MKEKSNKTGSQIEDKRRSIVETRKGRGGRWRWRSWFPKFHRINNKFKLPEINKDTSVSEMDNSRMNKHDTNVNRNPNRNKKRTKYMTLENSTEI